MRMPRLIVKSRTVFAGKCDVAQLPPRDVPFHLGQLDTDGEGSGHERAPRSGRGVIVVAEGLGFEPTEACASLVFKTSTFVRSVIPPERRSLAFAGR